MVKNHCLYQDIQNLKDDLDDMRRECESLYEKEEGNPCHESDKVQGSQYRNPNAEPPSERVKGKGRVVPTTSYPHLPPGKSQATPMVID
jgi:hypothetical protein